MKSIESLASLRGTNTQDLDLVPMQINNVGCHVLSRSEVHTLNRADNTIKNVQHTREKRQSATDLEDETTMTRVHMSKERCMQRLRMEGTLCFHV